jgi:hypothetical protein
MHWSSSSRAGPTAPSVRVGGAFERDAHSACAREVPSLEMRMHVAADWTGRPEAAERCREDLRAADLVLVTQLFLEDQAAEVVPTLAEHRERYDALVCAMSCPEVMRLTRMGRFSMGGPRAEEEAEGGSAWSPAAIFRRLRGSRTDRTTGEAQVRQLRRVPQLLRFVPGTAQDVRAYYLVLQYWLAGSEGNLADLVRHLLHRYAASEAVRKRVKPGPPAEYPEVGVYHPDLPGGRMADDPDAVLRMGDPRRPVVGLLLMRSYLLAGNTAHYDAVIRALEARGLRTLPAFAYGLDSRPALERVFRDPRTGRARVDALVSLTGFSLVGGPAYNDAAAAREQLAALDVPYLAAQPLEFQTVEAWREDPRGLSPLQATLMVAIPELDGATGRRSSPASPRAAGPTRSRWPSGWSGWRTAWRSGPRCGGPRRRSAGWAWCSSASRPTRATPGPPPSWPCGSRCTTCCGRCGTTATRWRCRRARTSCGAASWRGTRSAPARSPTCTRASPPTSTCGARPGCGRSRRRGAPRPAASRATARPSRCWASASATCSWGSSPPSATRATPCASSSSAASPPRTPSPPSTAGCARTSARTPCSTSARTGRWSSCPASRWASPRSAGRTA